MTDSGTPDPAEPTQLGAHLERYAAAAATDATRHLSAAAYLDEPFCRAAIVDVYHEHNRLVAPSYGFDVLTVLHHCRRARRGYVWRDVALTGAIGLGLFSVVGIPALILLALSLASLRHLRDASTRVWRAVRETGSDAGSDAVTTRTREFFREVIAAAEAGGFGLVLLGGAALLLWLLAALRSISSVSGLVSAGWTATVMLFLAVVGTTVGSCVWCQLRLDELGPDRPLAPPVLTRRLARIAEQQHGNVTVYSGREPFLGSGWRMFRWQVSIRLTKAAADPFLTAGRPGFPDATATGHDRGWDEGTEFPEPPFDAVELIDHVRERLCNLAGDQPDAGEPAYTVESRVFLSDIRRPAVDELRLSEPEVHRVIRFPTTPARHYLACQVVSSRGELVTHVYLAIDARRTSLYVELTAYVLPPTKDRYGYADRVGNTGPAARLRAAGRGLLAAPELTAGAPSRLMKAVFDRITTGGGGHRRSALRNQGARISLREHGSDQRLSAAENHDANKWARTIERQTTAYIYEFLDSRKVDITEYRQRTVNILNEGIWNTGNLHVEGGVAVGPDSQVNPPPAQKGKPA